MFNNPGGKIQGLAKVLFVLGVIGYSIGGIILIVMGIQASNSYYDDMAWMYYVGGVLAIGVGVLISWLGVLFMFAFGNLVENVERIRSKLDYQSYQNAYQQTNYSQDYPQTNYSQDYQQTAYSPSYPQNYQP